MFALFCLLVVLKLLGYFMFSWWLVFAPLLAMILGLMIVVFTVVNTMTMSVMERVNEIGTARAMGVRRSLLRAS